MHDGINAMGIFTVTDFQSGSYTIAVKFAGFTEYWAMPGCIARKH